MGLLYQDGAKKQHKKVVIKQALTDSVSKLRYKAGRPHYHVNLKPFDEGYFLRKSGTISIIAVPLISVN